MTSTSALLEAIGARARAELAAARRTYAGRVDDGRVDTGRAEDEPETQSLPRLMVRVQLDRVGPCSGRRRS